MIGLNMVLAMVGGPVSLVGLLSAPIERSLLSTPLIALTVGVLVGPAGFGLLRQTESDTGVSLSDEATDPENRLSYLCSWLVSVRNELVQFPITYHVHGDDEKNALSMTLVYLDPRLRPTTPNRAVEDFASVLATCFLNLFPPLSQPLPSSPLEEILKAYARVCLYHLKDESGS